MAALDFPASPTLNQTFTGPNNVLWVWDGAKWVAGTSVTGAYAPIASPAFTGDPQAPTANPGDADASIASTAFVAAAVAPALHNIGRNLIHNPLFNVAQRGAGPFTVNGANTLDRWQMSMVTDTLTIYQVAASDAMRAGIGDEAATNVMQATSAGTVSGQAVLLNKIEDAHRLGGKTVTVSFYASAGSAGLKLGASINQTFGTGGSPSAATSSNGQSVAVSNTAWARYSLTFTIPSTTGKTFGTNGDSTTTLVLWFSAGGDATHSGGVGMQSGTIQLWGVQLEVGSVATPLEKPDPRYDLSNCQRFYQSVAFQHGGYTSAGALLAQSFILPTMRSTPTTTPNVSGATNVSGPSFLADSPGSVRLNYTAIATGATEIHGSCFVSADL